MFFDMFFELFLKSYVMKLLVLSCYLSRAVFKKQKTKNVQSKSKPTTHNLRPQPHL